MFFKDGRSGGGGGHGSSSGSRRGSRVGGGSGPGLGAPAAPAGVLCVPAAVRREPLHDRVRYLQGLVPRQVNKPSRAPPPPATGQPPPPRRPPASPSAWPPRRAPSGPGAEPPARAARRAGPRARRLRGGLRGAGGIARPGEESPQQTGTKGAGREVGRGRPGRGDAAGAGAGAGGGRSAGPARRPSRRPQPGRRPARPRGHPLGAPGRESPPAWPPSPAGRRALLPGGDPVARLRGSRNRSGPLPRRVPVAPPSQVFIKLPRPGVLRWGRRQRQPGGAPRSKQSNR